jgi:hypothetical protein
MITSSTRDLTTVRAASPARSGVRLVTLAWAALLLIAGLMARTAENAASFGVLATLSLLPIWIWMRRGAPGIPVFPCTAVVYIQYFAWPLLTFNPARVGLPPESLRSATFSVGAYLLSATLVSLIFATVPRLPERAARKVDLASESTVHKICLGGLTFGLLFQIGYIYGFATWFGATFGVIRAFAFGFVTLSCYLLGAARGEGVLSNRYWYRGVVLIGLLIGLAWTSLYLVQGIALLGVTVLGYFIKSRRILLIPILVLLPLAYVLHAGKGEMRERSWGADGMRTMSLGEIPGHYFSWFSAGVAAISTGDESEDLFSRARLLQLLLMAQERTPKEIEYLNGATYALLPAMLVPRFLAPDKLPSQAAMNLLNLRYGLVYQRDDGSIGTAIGWGMVAEGYANFGIWGIVAIGVITGLMMGAISYWSEGQSTSSAPTLFAILALSAFVTLETDFTYLCTILFQGMIVVLIFRVASQFLVRRTR